MTHEPGNSSTSMTLAASLILLLAAGGLHGHLTHRWVTPDTDHCRRISESLPATVGDWKSTEIQAGPQTILRDYRHALSGRTIKVCLVVGDADAVSKRRNGVFFGGRPYRPLGDAATLLVRTGDDVSHFVAREYYDPSSLETAQLVIAHSWNETGDWEVPAAPRARFNRAVCAVRLSVAQLRETGPADRADVRSFLGAAAPLLAAALRAGQETAANGKVRE